MKQKVLITAVIALAAMLAIGPVSAKADTPQVLATVGKLKITADDLESALRSAPYAVQFTTLDEKAQAGLRGNMLQRLVNARLLQLEAQREGLDRTKEFSQDIEAQRAALLYRHYMDKLRERITVPADTLAAMKKQLKGDADSLAATKSAYRSDQYRTVRLMTIQKLRDQRKVKLHEERIVQGIKPNTVLLEGDGIRIAYGDVVNVNEYKKLPNPEWIKEQLYKRAELLLVAQTAEKEGVDVSAKVERYRKERLPSFLLEQKEKKWVPNEKAMRAWLKKHPEESKIPERRHIGQLVVADHKKAEELRKRILKGESLFKLAGKYSIDEAGRKQLGDMGWIMEGKGYPQLDKAASKLKEGEVSEVIKTPLGYHLVTVLDRRPGGVRHFEAVKDRVRQLMIREKLMAYLKKLEQRHKVVWLMDDHKATGKKAGSGK